MVVLAEPSSIKRNNAAAMSLDIVFLDFTIFKSTKSINKSKTFIQMKFHILYQFCMLACLKDVEVHRS